MNKRWTTTVVIVFSLAMLAILFLILGMRIYTRITVTQIDSLRVQTTDVKTLKARFPELFRKPAAPEAEWADSSQVLALSIFHKHDSEPLSDKDKLASIDQFYYNTYDRLLNSLAIILTTASIFIAFFGGVIPFLRSEKAEKLLDKVTVQVEEARKSQQHLQELVDKSQEVELRVKKLIDSLKKRAGEIRGKIVAKSGNIDEILKFTPSTRQQLQRHYDDTETLLNLGEDLDADNVMMRCIYYIANGLSADYAREFSLWLDLDQSDRPYILSGIAFQNTGESSASLKCYEQALQIRPGNHVAHYNKGIALDEMQQYTEALKCYNQALQIKPDFLEAWINKGIAYSNLEQYEQAIQCYDQALAILPDEHEAWFNKGNAYVKLGNCAEAAICFDNALKAEPSHAESWYNKGNALGCQGKFAEADLCYAEALKHRPDYPEALCNKGYMLCNLERYPEALQCLDRALLLKPDFKDALVNKGNVYNALEQYAVAIRYYNQALELAPEDHEAWLNKGVAHFGLGELEASLAAHNHAARIRPEDPATWLCLARIQARTKDREGLLASLRKALELDPALKAEIAADQYFTAFKSDPEFAGVFG